MLHRELVNAFRKSYNNWSDVGEGGHHDLSRYVLRHLCRHILGAGLEAEAAAVLRNFQFVCRRIQLEGGAAVARDAEAVGKDDAMLRELAMLLRDPRCVTIKDRYQTELNQVCALLPKRHELRKWAEQQGQKGLWAAGEEQSVESVGWEPVKYPYYSEVTALAFTDGDLIVLVAKKSPVDAVKSQKLVVLQAEGLSVVDRFQLDSEETFEMVVVVNGGQSMIFATQKGELFVCTLPRSLQQMARLCREESLGMEKVTLHKVDHFQELALGLAWTGCALVILSDQGRITLRYPEFEGETLTLRASPCHEVQRDKIASGVSPSSRRQIAREKALSHNFAELTSELTNLGVNFEHLRNPLNQLIGSEKPQSLVPGLIVSSCGNFISAFLSKSVVVLEIQDKNLKVLYEKQHPKSVGDACFMTLPTSQGNSSQTLFIEAVGSSVFIHKVDGKDILEKVESLHNVSAVTSDGNVLFIYCNQKFSMWSVSFENKAKKLNEIHSFKDGCAFLCCAKFPTFISGMKGELVQMHKKQFPCLKHQYSCDLRGEVMKAQEDLYLVEDIPQRGVKMTNLRTVEVVDADLQDFKGLNTIHGLSQNAEKLAITDSSFGVHVFDVSNKTKASFPLKMPCTAIRPYLNGCLFLGIFNGSILFKRSDSSELIQINDSDPSYSFVKYLIPIHTSQELVSFSLGPQGCKVQLWANIESSGSPECKMPVFVDCGTNKLERINLLPTAATMFCETHAACPTISATGRYMAFVLPSRPNSVLCVIDLVSGKKRQEMLSIMPQGNVTLIDLEGVTFLFAICHRQVLRAKIDQDFFDRSEPTFTEVALSLDEELKLLTPLDKREMIITSSDAVTVWKLTEEGDFENGRLLVPRSVMTGKLTASYVTGKTMVIVTQNNPSIFKYNNHFYILYKP